MINDLNQCQFIGRLGKDPELKYLQSGDAVANFTLACGWKTKEKEGVEWINVTAFGKKGELVGQYLKKGSQVFISGRMKTDKYTDKNGVEKYSTKIQAETIQFLGKNEAADAIAPVVAPTTDDSDIPF
jgi:single-strand DNA-binding protein